MAGKKEKPAISNKCRVHCNYHSQRRPFRAKDAARACCLAMAEGDTWAMIKFEVAIKCGEFDDEPECDCIELEKRLKDLKAAIEIGIEIALTAAAGAKLLKAAIGAWKKKPPTPAELQKADQQVQGVIDLMKKQVDLAQQESRIILETLQKAWKPQEVKIIQP